MLPMTEAIPAPPRASCLFQPCHCHLPSAQEFMGHSPSSSSFQSLGNKSSLKLSHQEAPLAFPPVPRKAKADWPQAESAWLLSSTTVLLQHALHSVKSWHGEIILLYTQKPQMLNLSRASAETTALRQWISIHFCNVLNISFSTSCMFIHSTLLRLLFSFIPFPISVSSLIFMHFYFHLYTFHHFNILIFQQSN